MGDPYDPHRASDKEPDELQHLDSTPDQAGAKEELEAMVRERTAALLKANERLTREIAERKEVERLLRRSETRYKELAELLPQIVFELDENGSFSFINCSGLEALGYTWRDLRTGIKAIEVLVPGERERFATSMSRVLHGKKLDGIEYMALRKDGSTFPLLVYSSPIERDDAVLGVRGVAIDITGLRKAQEDLWIKNFAMASSINAIAMSDLKGNLTYVNPSFLKLWRYSSVKEVRERSVAEFWQKPEESMEVVEKVTREGWWIGELTARRKDGSHFEAQISATMVSDETGQPIGMMASFLDVTERKEVREALRSSEERFRAVFEAARDCIYIKDHSLRYTHVNRAVERLLGLPAARLLGRTPEDVFGPEAGKRINEVGLRVLAGAWVEEEHTRPVNGEALTFHEVSVPLMNQQGEISGTCTISRNVTERKKTQPAPRITVTDYPSPAMRETLARARHAATRDSIVLLHGESGSGKDYVAQWIHSHSRRASGPFFAINCAALPQELAESELFGHEPGAFTGARARKRGLLELAEGGTILLNEIGELSLALQSKLLTFLDTRSFLRVGGEKRISIHARLMAATHRTLEEEVAQGRFLTALFYRLNVFSVHVPSLRERKEDFPVLVDEIMSALAAEMQLTEIPAIDSDTLESLITYRWPGNVRELRNVLERSLMLWEKGPFRILLPESEGLGRVWAHTIRFPEGRTLNDLTGDLIAAVCREALRRADWNKTEAAERLGISRYTLYRHMKSFRIACENETAPS